MQASTETKFKVGDKAVYPARGVAEVVSIETKEIAGNKMEFYVLRVLNSEKDDKIMVPVAKAQSVGLRPPITEGECRKIFTLLKKKGGPIDQQTWNRRHRGFTEKINTGSIFEVAEVLRDLYRIKADKDLSFSERRMLQTAQQLVVKEIAVARAKTEDKITAQIEKIFENN